MSKLDIVRAWKDEAYRQSLSEEERARLPENPAGSVELSTEEAAALQGGAFSLFRADTKCPGDCCCTATHHCVAGFKMISGVSLF